MPPIYLVQLPDHATGHGHGVPAFNRMEQGCAIMNAVRVCDATVIPRASLKVRRSCVEGVLDPRVAAA